jgi:uncharacterized membrane protein YcaP (DUF421 family)
MTILEVTLRAAVSFLVLFVLARILGRKEISQMTFFNFVSAIAIGSIAANLVLNPNVAIRSGVVALIAWSVFTILMGMVDIKYKPARIITTGDPLILIKEGKIVESALRKTRLDLDSLNAMLRQKNIFAIADVDFAIFETNGQLSVLPKEPNKPMTKGDMNVPSQKKLYPLTTSVVSDGTILTENLTKLNLSEEWLQNQLQQAGYQSPSDVFYAEILQNGQLYIDRKETLLH